MKPQDQVAVQSRLAGSNCQRTLGRIRMLHHIKLQKIPSGDGNECGNGKLGARLEPDLMTGFGRSRTLETFRLTVIG